MLKLSIERNFYGDLTKWKTLWLIEELVKKEKCLDDIEHSLLQIKEVIAYRGKDYIGIDERLSKGMISIHRLATITEIHC